MKLDKCPKCGCPVLGDRLTTGRRLEQYCKGWDDDPDEECDWVGEPRTPEAQRIVKSMSMLFYHGPHFTTYDRFGQIIVSSQTFPSKNEAMPYIQKELKRGVTDTDAGPYTALWWTSKGAYAKGTPVELEP